MVATVLGMSATTPASADPYWQTYTMTSHWSCTHHDWPWPGVSSATCVIVNGNATQAAVIVSNQRYVQAEVGVSLNVSLYWDDSPTRKMCT